MFDGHTNTLLVGRGTTYVVLTSTSRTIKVNGNSKTNSVNIVSSLTRYNKVPFYSILYIEKYCYDSFGMIGILCGYYIRLVLLWYDLLTRELPSQVE